MELRFDNRNGIQWCRTATHIYLKPHRDLLPWVAHYTLHLGGGGAGPVRPLVLVPDGAGCLGFTLEDGALAGRIHGPSAAAVTVENDLKIRPFRFFVEFVPGGLRAFCPIPQSELAGRIFPLGLAAPALDAAFQAAWRDSSCLDEFIQGVDRLLRRRCPAGDGFSHVLALTAGRRGVAAAAADLAYSPRHLGRLFQTQLGLSPKTFSQVMRVNRAAQALRAGQDSLTWLAQELGYYDQSHFIRAFRQVCGVTPTAFQDNPSDFYNETRKLAGMLKASQKMR